MRLTLRNMLAYMDGIFDAEDAEEIGKRIAESQQATNLLHRTRDVMRRLRLAAPSLTDRGPGLDPNTVAEYLDHTLHDNRVTDFEKVCLDSDVHLAEVASCHQILALVLGEAAEIAPASRQRMYDLPSREAGQSEAPPAAPPLQTSAAPGGQPDSEPSGQRPRPKPTVPDYLRDPPKKRRLLPISVALLTAACLALIVLGALGQFDSGTPVGNTLARLLGSDPTHHAGPGEPESQQPESESPTEPAPEKVESPKSPPAEQPPVELPDQPALGQPDEPTPQPPQEPTNEPPEEPQVEPAGEPGVPRPLEAPKGLAGLMSEKQILLRFDSEAGHWQRVPQQGIVTAGQELLALPTCRPLLALMSAEVTIQLIDGARAVLLPSDANGLPGLKVDYGRLVLRTVGKPDAQIQLQVGNWSGLVTFADAQSVVALEVIPIHIPGTDPEAAPGVVVADMYTQAGQILWDQADGEGPLPVPAGYWVLLSDQPAQPPTPLEQFPKWISGEDMDSLEKGADRLASATLTRELQVDRSLRLGARLVLMELNDHARRENRWLAARCLAHIGDFGPLVQALNDADYPPVWTDESIGYLRAAVARSAQAASQVRQAMERQYGQDAPEMYRMLWGYTEEGLKAFEALEAENLIDHLNHESLAMRTLAFWNLKDVFGLGLLYRPTDREAVRRSHAERWKRRLDSGEIWNKLPEETLPPEESELPEEGGPPIENQTEPIEKAPLPEDAVGQP